MHEQFLILKKHEDILTAQHLAQLEYERFFREFHAHIQGSDHNVLRERYRDEGKFAYIISVNFTEQTSPPVIARMQEWSSTFLSNDLPGDRRWVSPVISLHAY